jgi:hypothetical protein
MSLPIHRNQETHHGEPSKSPITFDFNDNGGFEFDDSREGDKPTTLPTEREYTERRNKEIGNHGDRNPFLTDEPDYSSNIEQNEKQRSVAPLDDNHDDNERQSDKNAAVVQEPSMKHGVYQNTSNNKPEMDESGVDTLDDHHSGNSRRLSLRRVGQTDIMMIMLPFVILGYALLHIPAYVVLPIMASIIAIEDGIMIYHRHVRHEEQGAISVISCILSVLSIILITI